MSTQDNSKQRASIIVVMIILGCLFIAFFGLRAFHAFKKFNGYPPPADKIETDVERIRDWMTVPFIARMYDVPEEVIFDALGIPPQGNRKKSLEELDDEFFPEADGLAERIVKAAVLAHHPPPTPVPPLTPMPPSP
jgi:hypothetical protein